MMGARLLFARGAMVASAIGLTSGCNLIIEPDRKQCAVDEDCTNRGPAFANTVCGAEGMCMPDPTWSCLDGPPPEPPAPGPYYVDLHAQSILDQAPVGGAAVRLCRKLDPECLAPEWTGTTDPNGDATVEVPSSLALYLSIIKIDDTLPPEKQGEQWVPAYYYFNPNVTSDMTLAVQMATFALRGQLTFLLQRPQEPTLGLLLINTVDCLNQPAAGVVYRSDVINDLMLPFYVLGGIPNTSLNATNVDGYGGFVNSPTGTVVVSGEIQETGRTMGSVSLHVRPEVITYSRLVAIGQQSP